ncbi:hypothetical protein, partial [Rhizobium ruizarguesonis]|uniref:hypothetical protein n=1 Tax=Rhizobium ruizarguesonis TaxID=2081791 RepID=UPI0019543621
RAYLCHRHLLFKGWLKQPNPSNQKRIMQIPHSKCRASGFVQSGGFCEVRAPCVRHSLIGPH